MHSKTVIVKNIVRLKNSLDACINRNAGVEGMCLVYGATGAGKTTAISYLINQCNGIYVEASPAWSLKSMLGSIMKALGAEPKGQPADMESYIVDQMGIEARPLFVDELDHMLLPGQGTTLRMLEALRSLYDKSQMPVIMVGMDKIDRKIKMREQLSRRVFQWIRFEDLGADDIRLAADTLCELPVSDDFLNMLIEESQGRIGRVVLGLAQAERRAKGNRWETIDMDRWGNEKLYLGR